jgi:O-methyltransferase
MNANYKETFAYKVNCLLASKTGYKVSRVSLQLSDSDRFIINSVDERTMTDELRLANLCEAVSYLTYREVPGDFVECGVWRGGSVMAMAMKSKSLGATSRKIWLYDTFQGMTTPGQNDFLIENRISAKSIYSDLKSAGDIQSDYVGGITAFANLEDVKSGLLATKYPLENFKIVEGDVSKTLLGLEVPDKISLLRLDTDFYESTKISLEMLWPKLVEGGILILDDYDFWGGARQAVDEYFGAKLPFMMRMDSGRIIVKGENIG